MSLSSDKNGTPSPTAAIISSIGLSPLLIGISGILHEAYVSNDSHYLSMALLLTLSLVTGDTTEIRICGEPRNGHLLRSFTSL
jgi:hypothetical protein